MSAQTSTIEKVVKEREEVTAKLERLASELDENQGKFDLSLAASLLLKAQKEIMENYEEILDFRVQLMQGELDKQNTVNEEAPRVTCADIEAEISSEHYFTAEDGRYGAITRDTYVGRETPRDEAIDLAPLGLLTFCVLVLRNGFTVIGENACVSPENFNAEIGRQIARARAVDKIWPLLGFRMKDQLSMEPA